MDDNWTYGAEHEWADWDMRTELPKGYGRDTHDVTIVNSNGIANDPSGKTWHYGGEINTPPTDSIEGQIDCLEEMKEFTLGVATVNYRSNLHLHIRVPGLKDDLVLLKRFQAHIHKWMPKALPVIEPIPEPILGLNASVPEYIFDTPEYQGARRRYRRRKVSHHTLLKPDRVAGQMAANTIEEFFQREVPWSEKLGKPQWQCQPRLCVNLRQLRQTDTIEFRHFPGTMDLNELGAALLWVCFYTEAALNDSPIDDLLKMKNTIGLLPKFQPYCHWQEELYRQTCHDGSLPKQEIRNNIHNIQMEDMHDRTSNRFSGDPDKDYS